MNKFLSYDVVKGAQKTQSFQRKKLYSSSDVVSEQNIFIGLVRGMTDNHILQVSPLHDCNTLLSIYRLYPFAKNMRMKYSVNKEDSIVYIDIKGIYYMLGGYYPAVPDHDFSPEDYYLGLLHNYRVFAGKDFRGTASKEVIIQGEKIIFSSSTKK